MSPRLPALVGGVVLVAVGTVVLLGNLGVLPPGVNLWPVVLLAAGAVLLAAGLRQRHEEPLPEEAALPLDGARAARLVLKHGAGTLDVAGGGDPGLLFAGTFAGGVRQEAQRSDDRLEVTLRHPFDIEQLARQSRGLAWTLALGGDVPVDLEVHSGASRARLDLHDVPLVALRLQVGASDIDVRLPRGCRVHVSAGASDVRLHVPEGTAAAITTRSALASVHVDQDRFPVWGQGYRSPGWESADRPVEITLEGGVASFRVD